MKRILTLVFITMLAAVAVFAQEKALPINYKNTVNTTMDDISNPLAPYFLLPRKRNDSGATNWKISGSPDKSDTSDWVSDRQPVEDVNLMVVFKSDDSTHDFLRYWTVLEIVNDEGYAVPEDSFHVTEWLGLGNFKLNFVDSFRIIITPNNPLKRITSAGGTVMIIPKK